MGYLTHTGMELYFFCTLRSRMIKKIAVADRKNSDSAVRNIYSGVRKAGRNILRPQRKRVMDYNPASSSSARREPESSQITIFSYKGETCTVESVPAIEGIFPFRDMEEVSWINIDGLRREEVRKVCEYMGVHQLTIDDILSVGQRAKTDDFENIIFSLIPMLYFNPEFNMVEREQVSLLLFNNMVISFQEDPGRDAFNMIRDKLRSGNSRLRAAGPDALYSALLDAIVDQYFEVMEKLGIKIEGLEDLVIKEPNNRTLVRINHYRREISLLRRTISPVKDLIYGILKSESPLIQKKTKNYVKDIYDHIIQANETADNYRDLNINLQDLYVNQVNLKMNEIMKVLTVITALFVPLTLISGIYGMNFDNMPELHTRYGYYVTLGVMLLIFLSMLYFFKKRKWF